MSNFKVGDTVRRRLDAPTNNKVRKGTLYRVRSTNGGYIEVVGVCGGTLSSMYFDLVEEVQPTTTQVGGDHYKKYPKGYQPLEISTALGLSGSQMAVLKYLLRYKDKGGKQDLEKLIHVAQIMIELEYPDAGN